MENPRRHPRVNRGRSNIELPPRSTQLQKIPIEWSIHLMSGRAIEPNKVLIVEDNEQDRCLLESIVTSLGYPVETAMNGREALAKLETMQVAAILTDLMMPTM